MKILIMIYILIGFAIDVVFVIGSIYLKKDETILNNLRILSKKNGKNPYFVLVSTFVVLIFIWPYVMFIYKPKSNIDDVFKEE